VKTRSAPSPCSRRSKASRSRESPHSRRCSGILRSLIGIRRGLLRLLEHEIDLGEREAGDLDVEFQINKSLQLDGKQLAVPTGIEGQLVVGDDVGSALRRIEVGQAQRRNALHSQQLGGFHSAMPGDDLAVIADQHRIGEAEPLDAVGDLPDLLLGVGPGVSRIGSQTVDRHVVDDHCVLPFGCVKGHLPASCCSTIDLHEGTESDPRLHRR
jgi:hypothetical protein